MDMQIAVKWSVSVDFIHEVNLGGMMKAVIGPRMPVIVHRLSMLEKQRNMNPNPSD
jgi:hypothetical protein